MDPLVNQLKELEEIYKNCVKDIKGLKKEVDEYKKENPDYEDSVILNNEPEVIYGKEKIIDDYQKLKEKLISQILPIREVLALERKAIGITCEICGDPVEKKSCEFCLSQTEEDDDPNH